MAQEIQDTVENWFTCYEQDHEVPNEPLISARFTHLVHLS